MGQGWENDVFCKKHAKKSKCDKKREKTLNMRNMCEINCERNLKNYANVKKVLQKGFTKRKNCV